MFDNFSKLNLGLKLAFGFAFVLIISLASGVFLGKYTSSGYAVFGVIIAVVLSVCVAFVVNSSIASAVKRVLQSLSDASSNLTDLSKELTTAGHRLAEGTTEQASSIQETSSTLEESASMIHQTTQNTKEADVLSKRTKQAADKGNVEMQDMLISMEELKKSSGEISKIIKVIDEIAFQTNILSLNAAVEAARAGDAGKGFAVVAEEVRNLAQRSAQAAKDTSGIIESNIDLTEKCLEISEQVGESLVSIRDETHKVSELMDEITTASQEQEIGIVQINQAVSQMEQVLQANAATAQESASSANQLSGYSEVLNQIRFELVALISGNGDYHSTVTTRAPIINRVSNAVKTIKKVERPAVSSKPQRPTNSKKVQEFKPERIEKTENVEKFKKPTKSVNPEDIIPLDDF